jgi:hypothetical protein
MGSSLRAGAPVEFGHDSDDPAMRHFVAASRRMATTLERPPTGPRRDPGESLIELLGFADQVTAFQPTWPSGPGHPVSTNPPAPGPILPGGLAGRIVSLHELLDSLGVPHQFGGAIALAWYRNPRATTDIHVNLTVSPAAAGPVLGALAHLGVTVTPADLVVIANDGQARLNWDGSYLDVFFATMDLHHEMARQARPVWFGPVQIPILSPDHLVVRQAVFNRPKDWLDIEEMIRWGTAIDPVETRRWVGAILGTGAAPCAQLAALLTATLEPT